MGVYSTVISTIDKATPMSKQKQIKRQRSEECYINDKIQVSFNYSSSSSSSSYSSQQSSYNSNNNSVIPTFNFDRTTYTPSFYLPYKQIKKSKCLEKHRKKQEKCKEISAQSILVPKPRKRPYCHSCEASYQDYLQHINQSQHIENTTSHPVHYQILQLCRKFQKTDTSQAKDDESQGQKDMSHD